MISSNAGIESSSISQELQNVDAKERTRYAWSRQMKWCVMGNRVLVSTDTEEIRLVLLGNGSGGVASGAGKLRLLSLVHWESS